MFTLAMKHIILYIFLIIAPCTVVYGQEYKRQAEAGAPTFSLRGRVLTEDGKALTGVNIEGPNGRYATTDLRGFFTIPATIGDEIIIRRTDFETVYYRIRSSTDELEIRVIEDKATAPVQQLSYNAAMDSAQRYMRKDAKKTADFLIAALSNSPKKLSDEQQAAAYEKLGDLYLYNKQADLALTNYSQATALKYTKLRKRKQADALRLNGNHQEAIAAYTSVLGKTSGNTESLAIYTGLAESYTATKQTSKAIDTYNKAIKDAKSLNKKTELTALNAKLAMLLNASGRVNEAQGYFNKAITASKKESPVTNAIIQSQTADFYNSNAQFEKEIAMRQSNITLINKIDKNKTASPASSDTENLSSYGYSNTDDEVVAPTVQKEQLKIAEAYRAQNKIKEAIDYFEKSITEASANNDLDVKKDAARNLATLYRENGDNSKALVYNDLYIATIDALYLEKENELAESARRAKELVSNQTRILTLEKDRELNTNKIALINAENELTAQTNKRQRWIIYSLALVATTLLLLAYFMYRNNKQQKINNHLLALKSLRSQMNPHFIFNALNSVNSYIALNDERAANKYLTDFSKLMRSVLENSELDFIPLHKELELLSLYIKLEHERFKEQFEFTITIAPELEHSDYGVPPMLLQPIIENAVWHGLRYKNEKGFLHITFAALPSGRQAANPATQIVTVTGVQVIITDNGIGRDRSKAIKTDHQKQRDSKGLGNIKNRIALLNELHNHKITIDVTDAGTTPDVGTKVVVNL